MWVLLALLAAATDEPVAPDVATAPDLELLRALHPDVPLTSDEFNRLHDDLPDPPAARLGPDFVELRSAGRPDVAPRTGPVDLLSPDAPDAPMPPGLRALQELRDASTQRVNRSSGIRCAVAVGAAVAVAPPGRNWDLSTPGPVSASWSPVVSQRCYSASQNGWARTWASVDIAPWLKHSYGGLGVRAPVLATGQIGIAPWVGAFETLGPFLVTNGMAWGSGIRFASEDEPYFTLEAKAAFLNGSAPTFMTSVAVTIKDVHTGILDPDDAARVRDPPRARRWRHGLELGSLTGIRVEHGNPDGGVEVGLRLGIHTDLLSDTAVQPTALATVDVPLHEVETVQAALSGGVVARDGDALPVAGLALQIDPRRSAVQGHVGGLFGSPRSPWLGLDAGVALIW